MRSANFALRISHFPSRSFADYQNSLILGGVDLARRLWIWIQRYQPYRVALVLNLFWFQESVEHCLNRLLFLPAHFNYYCSVAGPGAGYARGAPRVVE